MNSAQIIEYAREVLGTPFAHQGRVPGLALDCIGLAIHVARRAGFNPVDVDGYGPQPHAGLLEQALDDAEFLDAVALPLPGDILLMRFADDPQHVAILTGPTIIHSYANAGKVVEHHYSPIWQARTVRGYRFKRAEQ